MVEGGSHRIRFLVNLPLDGIPQGREESILLAILSDRERFLHYLRLILADVDMIVIDSIAVGTNGDGRWWRQLGLGDQPLFEAMVKALSRSPEKIDRIAEVVGRLEALEHADMVIPKGLKEMLAAIITARGQGQ
jgi:hypothetical protein